MRMVVPLRAALALAMARRRVCLGLVLRTLARYRRLAVAAALCSAGLAAAQTAQPAAPTGFVAYQSGSGEITLQWDNPGDSSITRHQLRYLRNAGGYGNWADIQGGDTTSTVISSLDATSDYRFQLRACASSTCGNDVSEASVEMSAARVTSVTITSSPRSGDTYTVGETIEVTVTWSQSVLVFSGTVNLGISIGANTRTVGHFGGRLLGVTSIRWRYTVVAADVDSDGISIGASAISGLRPPTGVGGRDQASRTIGRHRIVNSTSHKVDGGLAAPAAPAGLMATRGFRQVTLNWTDPEQSGIGGYEIRHAPAAENYSAAWSTISASHASTTEHTVGALTNETEYKFQIRATNGVGAGSSAEVRATPTAIPLVTDVRFVETPRSGIAYGAGELVRLDVEFSVPITVTGAPRLALTIGAATRQADFESAGSNTVRFRYQIVAADRDTDGIGVASTALTLNGGTIVGADGRAAVLGLRTSAFTANADHKVDGSTATPPAVGAVRITSTPQIGNTYGGGEQIDVEVEFTVAVPILVTGSPQLLIRTTGGPVFAALRRTSGQSLHFSYLVRAQDSDGDGISILANALGLNGGTIRSLVGAAADRDLGSHAIADASNHRVAGSIHTVPIVTTLSIASSPVSGDTYGAGEAIRVEVGFDLPVAVTGRPQVALTLGAVEVYADYQSGSATKTLTFRYVVQAADQDSNGLDVSALALNSGTIQSTAGVNARLAVGALAISTATDHKANGATATVPTVNAVAISSAPARGDTYGAGEAIAIQIGFTIPVVATGTPQVALAIGSRTRYATYSSGSGTSRLTFEYAALAIDIDDDGLSVGQTALGLNGGAIRSTAAASSTLALGGHAISNAAGHKVDGRATAPAVNAVSITSSPASGNTYRGGETISVQVGFASPVTVTGTPVLELTIGTAAGPATYASGSGTKTLTFNYEVRAIDVDANGIGVAANALTRNGGRIRSGTGANATLGLGANAFTNAARHRVDGRSTAPAVNAVSITSSPASGSTYGAGETISVQVGFHLPVTVAGVPQLALTMGTSTASAAYAGGSGTKTLTFTYDVLATDVDANGISIGPSALALNSGTIRSTAGTNAALGIGAKAITNAASHRVNGTTTAPAVVSLAISSDAGSDNTYTLGQVISVQVGFQMAVTVTGTPQLVLTIGTSPAPAAYARGSDTNTLTFQYTVQTADLDANGISIEANALLLNRGTIRSTAATSAALALGANAISDAGRHRVNGQQAPIAEAPVGLTATPSGDTQVELRWSNPNNSAIASYEFRYWPLSGSEGTWRKVPGSHANTVSHSIVSGLSQQGYRFEVRALVEGTPGPASAADAIADAVWITAAAITSTPANGYAYVAGEHIDVTLTLSANTLEVGENPELTINVGSNARTARKRFRVRPPSVYTVVFRYTVTSDDEDVDGISVGPHALKFRSRDDYLTSYSTGQARDASPTLGRHQIVDDPRHKVARGGPAAPSGLRATAGNARAILDWTSPQDTAITSYELRHVVASAPYPAAWSAIPRSSAATTQHAVESLRNGTEYRFQIRARNASGPSPPSADAWTTPADIVIVNAVRFTSGPQEGDTYGAGEVVEIEVQFSDTIRVTGDPRLALTVGANVRQAAKESVSSSSIRFRYAVRTGDLDTDGIGIAATALSLNHGTITDTGGSAAQLGLGSNAYAANERHKVNGASATAATVSLVRITSTPASGDTYEAGEPIDVEVRFGALVQIRVTGSAQLALTIGAQSRQATLRSTSGQSLHFRYVVQSADADTDGVGIAADALTANGGTVQSLVGAAANLNIGPHAITAAGGHKVKGSTAIAPTVTAVAVISSPVSADTYGAGERIAVRVTFGIPITVTGNPQLMLTIGAQSRAAAYQRTDGLSLHFEYTVVAADADSDGVGIGVSALVLNGGAINSRANAAAALDLGSHAISRAASHKVDGTNATPPTVSTVRITSTPVESTGIYGAGERIEVEVRFAAAVAIRVTGSPQLALTIGRQSRSASLLRTSGQSLHFGYLVQRTDLDTNGLSIGSGALTLNQGTIQSVAAADANLSLGAHAIADAGGHSVVGVIVTVPRLVSAVLASSPKSGDTYGAGETISVRVAFSLAVIVTGHPQLALTFDSGAAQAAYASGSGTRMLMFQYVVQAADTALNGVGIGARALTLNGGTIRSAIGTNATLRLSSILAPGHKVDGRTATAPSVTAVSVSSSPVSGDTYGAGERVEVQVGFDIAVAVTGSPQLALDIGGTTRQASHVRGSGTSTLVFGYVVQSADVDTNGIGVGANALTSNSGTITSTFGATAALGSPALDDDLNHKVDGSTATMPQVSAVSITGTPASASTYGAGETIEVQVVFNVPVTVAGSPQLTLGMATGTVSAAYSSGSGTKALVFEYEVLTTDADADGISVAANALALNGGTIHSAASVNAALSLAGHAVSAASDHKVDGRATAPTVNSVAFTSAPANGDTYGAGETIMVSVGFQIAVTVAGTPQLALSVGGATRQAAYAGGSDTKTLTFSYAVQPADADPNGVGVPANALALNGGMIRSRTGTNAALALGANTISDDAGHNVDGSVTTPAASSVSISSTPASGDTYEAGETINVQVRFSEAVTVTGTPQLALGIGSATRPAAYASGSGTNTLTFSYVTMASDEDNDGISVGARALSLDGGTISTATAVNVWLGLGIHAIANAGAHKVDGSTTAPAVSAVSITSSPASGATYGAGETISVRVGFTLPVTVTGQPSLSLGIGGLTRVAGYSSGSETRALVFTYVTKATDADTDGIGVPAAGLTLSGGTIQSAAGTNAALGLGGQAIAAAPAHRVDGRATVPTVSALSITSSPANGDEYQANETISVQVEFTIPVRVTGTPQLALTLGTSTLQANYASGGGTNTLIFQHLVTSSDSDNDGIGIGTGALGLNGGTIRSYAGTNAALSLGTHAIAAASAHKVNGATSVGTVVAGISFTSWPAIGTTYGLGETVTAEVEFNTSVTVTGTPYLELTIGANTRSATYASGSGTPVLTFSYAVSAADEDDDGIGVGGTALKSGSGAINGASGSAASLSTENHKIPNASGHQVDGKTDSRASIPVVAGVALVNNPATDTTYRAGETIIMRVRFNLAVTVTGTPQLALTIGSAARQAAYASGSGSTTLTFRYTVDATDKDTDGFDVGADALSLNGGTIRSGSANAALGLGVHTLSGGPGQKVDGTTTVPTVNAVSIISSPASGDTYGAGETITVRVGFQMPVLVTGTPRFALDVGSSARPASYAGGSGTNELTFSYVVAATDADNNGISGTASALALNRGTIQSWTAINAVLRLPSRLADRAGHKVNGAATAPVVNAVAITSSPASGDTYGAGETITVQVGFHIPVTVTDTPQLALGMGAGTVPAAYVSGSGTKSLAFQYEILVTDADTNGISVAANALSQNSGTIQSGAGTAAALDLGLHALANSGGHKVNGAVTPPAVRAVTISSSPASGDTYGAGETITVQLGFQIAATVTGTPQLALGMGTGTVPAAYASGSGTKTLVFAYEILATDADTNGISVAANALSLNSGTIQSGAGTDATLALGMHALADAGSHKVNGAATAPAVNMVTISSSPASGDTYGAGERITVQVSFHIPVTVTGTPQLALGMGASPVPAAYGSGTTTLVFAYEVVATDADPNGISVAANALSLNSGAIQSAAGTAAALALGTHALSDSGGHKVNGAATAPAVNAVTISSSPASGNTYGAGETITVQVGFHIPVTVAGAPQLALAIESATVQAGYAAGSGTQSLAFDYIVQSADVDANGISVAAAALSLNEGTIRSGAGTDAARTLAGHAITNDADHAVNGAVATAPSVTAVAFAGTPVSGTTYGAGERIEVQVGFDIAVRVTGSPQLALGIGGASRQAAYLRGSGTKTLVFGYSVQSSDLDANGVSVGANALTLNSGRIASSFGGVAALALGSHALGDDLHHQVDGGAATTPAVSAVSITSAPANAATYGAGETITVQVAFNVPVTVAGTPRLALGIGAGTAPANYANGSGTKHLMFSYVVLATDADSDGIGIAANALVLNGGAIQSAANVNATLSLASHVISAAVDHKVDGSVTMPAVSSVSVTSAPVSGDTYGAGETITVQVGFHIPVTVTGTPQLALTIGASAALASYASRATSTLAFTYTVLATDADADGIGIAANALSLNGGTIRSAAATNAVLALGSHAIAAATGHKIRGAMTAPAVNAVSISSAPASGSTYGNGETISVQVGFQIAVTVSGTPQTALSVGSATRQAAYASGSGTKTLTFSYTVRAADADTDTDGVSIGAGALGLNSGTIQSGAGTNAALALGANTIADDPDHKVDSNRGPPGVTAVVLNSPALGDTYERGEIIEATVTFNKAVDVDGAPQLALTIGTSTRQAAYASGTGTASLVFRYTVVAADADPNGLSIEADALGLNSGTIDVAGGTTDALLGLGVRAIDNSASHNVAGGTFTAAAVNGATIASSPASGSTYGLGERIEVTVTFTRPVTVRGAPQLALGIGTSTRQAAYASGTGTNGLVFHYTVAWDDGDRNGISVAAHALGLNRGAVNDARDGTTAASLGLGTHAISDATNHKVDGSQGPPGVTSVALNSPVSGDTYERGEIIEATVTFNKAVDVGGAPQLALTIGAATRQAAYASGTGTASLVFRYTVAALDADPNGLGIEADALRLNGGAIDVAGGATDALLGLGAQAIDNSGSHKVAGGTFTTAAVSGATIASSPASGSTYALGERIAVSVMFTRRVTVGGTPQLALGIGTSTRQAAYASGTGTNGLMFHYTVVWNDSDSDGISVAAHALELNSGAVNDARDGTTAASLGLGTNAISDATNHKVDGSQGPPGVTQVALNSPVSGDTYERGETIEATVTFNKAVDVDGTPQLALTIGASTHQAVYASGTGTASLVFRYTVAAADADPNGLSIEADALRLNGGAIDVAGGATDALLGLGVQAIDNSVGHKVAGGMFTAAAVNGVAIASSPASDSTYGLGERIAVAVSFTRPVTVGGAPQLALGIGTSTRQAAYASGTGTNSLRFHYTVAWNDSDRDGISVATDALGLNRGTVNDARDGTVAASLGLGAHAILNSASHMVDGSRGPPVVTQVALNSPVSGDTFELGEFIEVTVTFNKAVDVGGAPQLALTIGAVTRQAAYASGTGTASLVFRYAVAPADADTDGLSIAADALGLNDGTIDVADGTTDALLGLGAQAISNSGGHKVMGDDGKPLATISSTNPATLTESNLDGATVTVTLTNNIFGSGVTQSSFTLTTGVPGLTIDSVTTVTSGDASATLTLDYPGTNFDTAQTLSVTVQTGVHTLPTAAVAVLPTPGVTVSETDLSLKEDPTAGGATNANVGTYSVVLDSQPTGKVTVTATSADAAVTLDTDATALTKSLTFAVLNWNTAQTVTATAQDDDDATDESVTVTHVVTGYGGVTTATSVTVAVDDNETAGIVIDTNPATANVVDAGPLALKELSTDPANSMSYSVRLAARPTADVAITITSGDTRAVTVDDTDGVALGAQNMLTFTALNWSTAQMVTLTAAQDDDGEDESVMVTHAVTTLASEYTGVSASLTATVDDEQTPAVVIDADPSTGSVVDAGPLVLIEGHATSTAKAYTVQLATRPTQAVTVALASADAGAVSIDDVDGDSGNGVQSTLTFASSTWDTAQTVTARAVDDADATDESVALSATASTATASEYRGVSARLTATVEDDEMQAVTLSASTLSVPEDRSETYSVRLSAQPVGGDVTVTITGAGDGVTVNSAALTFTSMNWNTARTVRASAADDSNGLNEIVTLTHTPSGADYIGVATAQIVVTTTDDDAPSLRVAPTVLALPEGATSTYTVRLNTLPADPVTVTVGGATAAVAVAVDGAAPGAPTALTFATSTWNTAQTVTVSAPSDDDATNATTTLTHAVLGTEGYANLVPAARPGVQVTVDDDDMQDILIDADPTTLDLDAGPLALHENDSAEYTVRLATQPTGPVTVTAASPEPALEVDADASPLERTLTFSTSTWATPQTVTAMAADDLDGGNETATIAHMAVGADYEDVTLALAVEVSDDDERAVAVAAAVTLDEGGMASSTVRLATRPTGPVTVAIATPPPGRDGAGAGHADVLVVDVEHGADVHDPRRRGRRRRGRDGDADAGAGRRGLYGRGGRDVDGEPGGQRPARRDAERDDAVGAGRGERELRGAAGHAAGGRRGDGGGGRGSRRRHHGQPGSADVHGHELAHAADGDGAGGGGRQPDARERRSDARGVGRGLRGGGRDGWQREGDGGGQRHAEPARGADGAGAGRGRPRRDLRGAPEHAAERSRDGDGGGRRRRHRGPPDGADVHDVYMERLADGDGERAGRRRRDERDDDADARGVGPGRLREPEPRVAAGRAGDGGRRRHAGPPDRHRSEHAGNRRRRAGAGGEPVGGVHGAAGDAAHRAGDGDGGQPRPGAGGGRWRQPARADADVLDVDLGHAADGHGAGGGRPGRRQRDGDHRPCGDRRRLRRRDAALGRASDG